MLGTILLSKCPRSYLLGFFVGDGSCLRCGKYWQYVFNAHTNDLPRVHKNALAAGVTLDWFDIYKGIVHRATWPTKDWGVLELQRLQGYTGYTFRTSLLPPWLNEISFVEGAWDAEGSARITPKNGHSHYKPQKELSITFFNEGLAADVRDLLKKQGLDPHFKGYSRRDTKNLAWKIYVRYKDHALFRQLYTLQPYKQAQLDRM